MNDSETEDKELEQKMEEKEGTFSAVSRDFLENHIHFLAVSVCV